MSCRYSRRQARERTIPAVLWSLTVGIIRGILWKAGIHPTSLLIFHRIVHSLIYITCNMVHPELCNDLKEQSGLENVLAVDFVLLQPRSAKY